MKSQSYENEMIRIRIIYLTFFLSIKNFRRNINLLSWPRARFYARINFFPNLSETIVFEKMKIRKLSNKVNKSYKHSNLNC